MIWCKSQTLDIIFVFIFSNKFYPCGHEMISQEVRKQIVEDQIVWLRALDDQDDHDKDNQEKQ